MYADNLCFPKARNRLEKRVIPSADDAERMQDVFLI